MISFARPVITATGAEGLTANTDGTPSFYAWSDIILIMAVVVAHGLRHIMMLTLETHDERVLMLSEVDAAWSATDNLHEYLPDAFPFSVWGQRLVEGAGFTEVWKGVSLFKERWLRLIRSACRPRSCSFGRPCA